MTSTHGFTLLREEHIAEVNSLPRLYRHDRTGAQLLSMINDDENKVFGITFRTPASDSTGLPHILEHGVLCGSRKYPLKEPFIELAKGSLNTFLNAMTYPDKTCYPVASQNLQDFYNLIDVYLDAVFYPALTPYTLKQEGWHYELESLDSEMSYKGVVFNEMKGAYSSPDDLLDQESQVRLYPNNTYGFDSGGDPLRIPDLTFDQYQAFHDAFYHPSNAYIYFYGDDDPQKRLELLDVYLRDFTARTVDSTVRLQPRFDQPRQAVVPYEASNEDTRSLLTVSWMLPETPNPELSIGLSVLAHILTGTPASPLRKALIDSGLGEDITGRGLDLGFRQAFYSVGMKGIAPENTQQVEQLILDSLRQLSRNGIDPETIAASLNTVEFNLRELNTGRFPRGLAIMLGALETWLYGGDPFDALRINPPLQAIKDRLQRGERYFERLIEEHFVENSHRSTVILEADAGLAERRAAEEQSRLAQARSAMTPEQLDAVVADTLELQRRQSTPDSPEALATIPTLRLSDLEPKVKTIPIAQDGPVLYHDLFTNGILYFDLGFDLHNLPQEWLPYVPVFSRALTETGTRDQSFVQLLQRIGRTTGGIRPATFISSVRGRAQAEAWLFLRGKAMLAQSGELLAILQDILSGVRLDDRDRIRQMVLEEKAALEAGLVRAGHRVINTRLRAGFDEAGWTNELTGGVSYLFFVRSLLEKIDRDWPAVADTFEQIRRRLVSRRGLVANVTLDNAGWQVFRPQLADFLARLPDSAVQKEAWQPGSLPNVEGLAVPSQVNYVGKGGSLFTAGYQLDGSVLAILNYLNATWLWEKVRVQGGAYGGFAVFDQHSGIFTYVSYRDPNLSETLDIYDQTAGFLRSLDLSENELTKAIIGAIGELDAYLLPDARGYTSMIRHLMGITDDWRQEFRDQLLTTRLQDFQQLADALDSLVTSGRVAALGSSESLKKVADERPGWMQVLQVL